MPYYTKYLVRKNSPSRWLAGASLWARYFLHQFQTSPLGTIELDDRLFLYVDVSSYRGG